MENMWHVLGLKDIEKQLNTDLERGLSIREARERLVDERKQDGGERRSLFVPRKSNYFKLAVSFFLTPCVLSVLIMSLLAVIFGASAVGALVLIITLIGCSVGGMISLGSQKKLELLQEYPSPMIRVKRGGNIVHTDGRNAVKGDVLKLSVGDILPCDARIISARSLKVRELFITKNGIRNRIAEKNDSTKYNSNDRICRPDHKTMLYAGSVIVEGMCEAVAIATGGDTYLSTGCGDGQLSSNTNHALGSRLEQILYRASFILLGAVAAVSLISIITLNSKSLMSNFLLLLSCISMISAETYRICKNCIFSTSMDRLSRSSRAKRDITACIRDKKSFDTLTKITDILILGNAAFTDGIAHVKGVYTAEKAFDRLPADNEAGRRLMNYIHAYLRALEESGAETGLVLDGVASSLRDYLVNSKFDKKGADLVLHSLYFAEDTQKKSGYACAETPEGEYRVLLTFDETYLSYCKNFRSGSGRKEAFNRKELSNISEFRDSALKTGGRCLYVISEAEHVSTFEGAIYLRESIDPELDISISQLAKMGISVTALFTDREKFEELKLMGIPFSDNITYASDNLTALNDITHNTGSYKAYVGFAVDDYVKLVDSMRQEGRIVAAYGIDDAFYDVLSHSDLAVSAEILRFSSAKHKESVYQSLPKSGRDSNIRCSQKTKLLSRILIHRSNQRGGGIHSLENAVMRSRRAHVCLAVAVLFFCMLMCSLLPFAFLPIILGVEMLNAVQAAGMSFAAAILSMTVFSHSKPKQNLVINHQDYVDHDFKILKSKKYALITRLAVSVCFIAVVKILDVFEIFGKNASYGMPIYLALICIWAIELFLINNEFTEKGEGRRSAWIKFLSAYAVLLLIGGIITQDLFKKELLGNGIGGIEYILVPIYCLVYAAAALIVKLFEKKRKKP